MKMFEGSKALWFQAKKKTNSRDANVGKEKAIVPAPTYTFTADGTERTK